MEGWTTGRKRKACFPGASTNPSWPIFLPKCFHLCPSAGVYLLWSLVTAIKWLPQSSPHTWATKIYLIDQVSLEDSKHSPFRIWFQEQALLGPFIIPVSELRTWGRRRGKKKMKGKLFWEFAKSWIFFTPFSPSLSTEGWFESKHFKALLISVFSSYIYPPPQTNGEKIHILLWGLGINLKQIFPLKCFNPQNEIVFHAFILLILFPTCSSGSLMCKLLWTY